eukprot:scaffold29955_cov129-Isochrysis_galbana.AAC.2
MTRPRPRYVPALKAMSSSPPSGVIMRARRSSHSSGGMSPLRDSTSASNTTLTAARVTGIFSKSSTVLPTDAASAVFLNGILGAFCCSATRSTTPFL